MRTVLIIMLTVFIVGCAEVAVQEIRFDTPDYMTQQPIAEETENTIILQGYEEQIMCESCDVDFQSPWGKMKSMLVKKGEKITWKTADVKQGNYSNVIFIWRGAMYGNGKLDLFLNNNFLISITTLSRDASWVSEDIILRYKYIKSNSGVFTLILPYNLVNQTNLITAKLDGEEYLMVFKEVGYEYVFKENATFQDIYGYDEIDYCDVESCDLIYDSAWGKTNVVFAYTGNHISWTTETIPVETDYAVYYFRASHFGNTRLDWFFNNKKILTSYAVNYSDSWENEGFKLEYDFEKDISGWSGTYYLWVPKTRVEAENKISVFVVDKGWIMLYKLKKEDILLLGSGNYKKVFGFENITECDGYCNQMYPTSDGWLLNSWIYKNQRLSWLTKPVDLAENDFIVFYWYGSQYGDSVLTWYLNNQEIITSRAIGYDRTWVNGPVKLTFDYLGFYGGYNGIFYLWVPKHYLTDQDSAEISVSVQDQGWVMVRD